MARRSVWSDPEVIALAARFVAAADEVGRLQRGQDEESRLFQRMAEHGHYGGRSEPSDTRQGIYALAPSGEFLASVNTRDPRHVRAMLETALARWNEMPLDARLGTPPAAECIPRWEDLYPDDGLVLRVFARDLPRQDGALPDDWRAEAWNQDFAWFAKAEARAFLPPEPRTGAEHEVPPELVRRIARLHLVDDVRGQVPAFTPESVEKAELVARVLALEGRRVSLGFEGATRTSASGTWPVRGFEDRADAGPQTRGFDARLLGRGTYDLAAERFVAFELVATGSRWGGTQFNGRGDDLDPAPMGVALVLAGSGPEERIAPALIWHYGWK